MARAVDVNFRMDAELKESMVLDMLIARTVQIAMDRGIIKSKSIIADAAHAKLRCNQKTPRLQKNPSAY